MKITKSQLKQIVKEEILRALREQSDVDPEMAMMAALKQILMNGQANSEERGIDAGELFDQDNVHVWEKMAELYVPTTGIEQSKSKKGGFYRSGNRGNLQGAGQWVVSGISGREKVHYET